MGSAGNKLSGFRRLPTLNKKPFFFFYLDSEIKNILFYIFLKFPCVLCILNRRGEENQNQIRSALFTCVPYPNDNYSLGEGRREKITRVCSGTIKEGISKIGYR